MKILKIHLLIAYWQNQPKYLSLILGVILVFFIGYIDSLIDPNISISIFYLIPILIATWFVREAYGFLMALMSVLISYLVNPLDKAFLTHPIISYWNASILFILYSTIAYLLSKLQKSLEREKKLARNDSITGVPNSRSFLEFADFEIKRAGRYKSSLTIAYLDIDNFKKLNDKLGQDLGNSILKKVAETIKKNIRVTDIMARLDGDEFVILLPETSYDPAQKVIRRVHRQLLEVMKKHGWAVTFSIGAVTFMNPPKSVEEMIERADNLMYHVKNNGKNTIKHEHFAGSSISGESRL